MTITGNMDGNTSAFSSIFQEGNKEILCIDTGAMTVGLVNLCCCIVLAGSRTPTWCCVSALLAFCCCQHLKKAEEDN